MDDVSNNHSHKYFAGKNYQKTYHSLDLHRLLYTNYQITRAHSTSITIVRITYFTVVISIYLIVLYLFCINQPFSNLFLFHFQTKDSDTHAYAYPWSSNDGDRNQQTTNFWACLFYNMFLYRIAIPFIGITFFCWQVVSGGLKKSTVLLP